MQDESNKTNNADNISYFEQIEARRYEKLKNAPADTASPAYPELNLDGCTQEEILFGFK